MPLPPAGSPGSKKRTFLQKVVFLLHRGADFQILDFGTPLEKSISLTFSEQWLCHFSKKVVSVEHSGRMIPVEVTTRQLRARWHGGGFGSWPRWTRAPPDVQSSWDDVAVI